MSKQKQEKAPEFIENVPTNRYASTREYCAKHGRAKLDIGGEKQCVECRKEKKER